MNLNKASVTPQFRAFALVGLTVVFVISLAAAVLAAVDIYRIKSWNSVALLLTISLLLLVVLLLNRVYFYFMFFWTAKGVYDVLLFPYRYRLGNLYLCFGQPDIWEKNGKVGYIVPVFVGPEKLRSNEKEQEFASSLFSGNFHKQEIFKMLTTLLKVSFPDIKPWDYYVVYDLASAYAGRDGGGNFILTYDPLSDSRKPAQWGYDRLCPPQAQK